jgi:UDP-N-acetylglucosamine diphosphorylase/glucosamine-1-phosphate N-acetyltransferase|tara:strand:- start:217 stop:942 length:726 start_codon:yes stop_codon:yes gene_type:complete
MNNQLHVGILAAGQGSRMESDLPKVLHKLNGKSLIDYVLETASKLIPESTTLVIGFQKDLVKKHTQRHNVNYVSQDPQLGTGHAVQQMQHQLENKKGHLLILYGDVPNITFSSLSPIINAHIEQNENATIITAMLDNPTGYGRIIRKKNGEVLKVVEEKDCSPSEKKIQEINSGIFIFKIPHLFDELKKIKSNNVSNEYYLTDVVELIGEHTPVQAKTIGNPSEIMGINTINQLNSLENSR